MSTSITSAPVLSPGTVEELRAAVRGAVLTPDDAGYDEARTIWNGMFDDARPALVVRCAGVADVQRAVELARSEGLEIAVRGGGHSIPGFSTVDGGIVIDLGPMNSIRVDPVARRAIVGPGAQWKDLDHETLAFGLAATGGLVSSTGVSGFTLGGGIGHLVRRQGLACDHLEAADVVTADGRLVRAGMDGDPELLWALKGGGGNFGVVTSLELRLEPLSPTIYGGALFFEGHRVAQLLEFFRHWTGPGLPDELSPLMNLTTAPPAPFLPEEIHGKPVVAVLFNWSGPIEQGERHAAPLRALGGVVADLVGPMPYVALQQLLDPLFAKGARNRFKAGYFREIPDAAIAELVRGHGRRPAPQCEIHLHAMGGAAARVPRDASAFPHRDAGYVLNLVARWDDAAQDQECETWSRETFAAVEPHLTGGAYVNFLGDEGGDRVRAAYGDATYARLQDVKAAYDPENVFHRNQNIRPTAVRAA
jgi:FAD/FMN-containing dehydrogenase